MREKSIKKRIFLSHIIIITITIVITAIVFNVCLNLYIKAQTKSQLSTAAGLVEKTLDQDFPWLEIEQKNKVIAKIDKVLRQAQFYFDIQYGVVGRGQKLLYPSPESSEEFSLLQHDIMPQLGKIKPNVLNPKPLDVHFLRVNGKQYAATFYPLKANQMVLVIYSDLSNHTQTALAVNLILFIILLLTGGIAFLISGIITKRISEPISQLSQYAHKIGERNYDVDIERFEYVELSQLAETMKTMASKLSTYDTTMKTFMQNASHELRTPLMSIQGYAEGIKYEVIDDHENAVDVIIEESKRLSGLVNDLLYLTKIDTIMEELNFENVNAEQFFRGCFERIRGLTLKSHIEITLYCEEHITLWIDEERFCRAVLNLLANGLRHAQSQVKVIVQKNSHQVLIDVIDDGLGIDEKDLPHIFKRFYKGAGGNYGLGLTIAKTVIEKHNGNLRVINSRGGGAQFTIELPPANHSLV